MAGCFVRGGVAKGIRKFPLLKKRKLGLHSYKA